MVTIFGPRSGNNERCVIKTEYNFKLERKEIDCFLLHLCLMNFTRAITGAFAN